MAERIEQPEKDSEDRTTRTKLPGRKVWSGTAWNSQDRTARKGQPGKGRQDRIARIGHPSRTARTGQDSKNITL